MIIKSNNTEHFTLSIKLNIEWDGRYIDIIVTLDNHINHKRQMRVFHGNEFGKAIAQYDEWEQLLF